MFRFKYQFRPTAHAFASEAEVAGFAKIGNALSSTSRSAYRATNCNAPHWFARGSNGCFGVTPTYEASSPVSTQEPATCQALFCRFADAAPFATFCPEIVNSPRN